MRLYLHIILILLLALPGSLAGQENREIDREKIAAYRSDSDFNYNEEIRTEESLLPYIFLFIAQQIGRFMGAVTNGGIFTYLFIAFCTIVIVLVILRVTGVSRSFRMFSSGNGRSLASPGVTEDVSVIDFTESIRLARQEGNHKELVRLFYLYALKVMDEASVITWKTGKTNREYLYEISDGTLRSDLSELNYYFDYAVYGEFTISPELAGSSEELFNRINRRIR